MIECGSLESLFNWQNTLMRREEAYHDKILHPKAKELVSNEDEIATIHTSGSDTNEDLKEQLIYDWHPKNSFVDHFSTQNIDLENFRRVSFQEVGDFANQPFVLDEKTNTFSRNGGIYTHMSYPTSVKKEYTFNDNSIDLDFTCRSDFTDTLMYGMEFNFHLAHPEQALFNGQLIEDGLSLDSCDTLEIIDTFTQKKLTLTCNQKCSIHAYTLKTVSQSESGFDTVAQQISLIFCVSFTSILDLRMNLEVTHV